MKVEIQSIWDELDLALIQKLIRSMDSRCSKCIQANGERTKNWFLLKFQNASHILQNYILFIKIHSTLFKQFNKMRAQNFCKGVYIRIRIAVKPGYGENLVWVNNFKSPSLYHLMLNYLSCVKPDLGKGFFRSLAIHPNQVLLYKCSMHTLQNTVPY